MTYANRPDSANVPYGSYPPPPPQGPSAPPGYGQPGAGPQGYPPHPGAGQGAPRPAAPSTPMLPDNYVPLALGLVGLGLTLFTMIPAGVITGPLAIRGARQMQSEVNRGERGPNARQQAQIALITGWVSLALGGLIALAWLGFVVLIVATSRF